MRARPALFVAFLVLCFLGGGGSRGDIASLLYLRPAAILCLAAILIVPGRIDWAAIRMPLLLLGALAIWMLIQLVPLPPALWTSLPGRAVIADGAAALAIDQPWRPISLAPALTLNSLAATAIPFAALIGFAALEQDDRRLLLPLLIGAAFVSALFGIAQISGGADSPFYLYRITNDEAAVGLFSNRNHEAALLALTFPMLALWAVQAGRDAGARRARMAIAGSLAIFLIPMILVTGSRAGLLLGAVAAAWACFQYLKDRRTQRGEKGIGWRLPLAALAVLAAVAGLFSMVAFSRAQAVQRLLSEGEVELRLQVFPVLTRMARELYLVGSGFGSFDPVYRIYEPDRLLTPRYLNQAHNDLLELTITGGLPALIILLLFILWWFRASRRAFGAWRSPSQGFAFARLGSFMIFLLFAWSLVDYPLRVPVMSAILAIACGWLGSAASEARRKGG
jgi:O-antigen ligase